VKDALATLALQHSTPVADQTLPRFLVGGIQRLAQFRQILAGMPEVQDQHGIAGEIAAHKFLQAVAAMRAASSCALASNSAFKGSFSDMVHSFTGDEFAIVPRLSHVVNNNSTNSSAAHTKYEPRHEDH